MDSNSNKKNEYDVVDECLNEFNVCENSIITPALTALLERIAIFGFTRYPWDKLKKLVAVKMDEAITEFNKRKPVASNTLGGVNTDDVAFEDMKLRLIASIEAFKGAPFTIQRLCELIVIPDKHYNTTEKFMRAIEKNLLVVSTVDPSGNTIVSEPRRTQQEVEPNDDESLPQPNVQPNVDSSLFLAPTSPAVDSRTSSSARFTMVRAPSVFNSPSLRGIASSGVSKQSCLLPFLSDTGSRKRRRVDCDSVAEKSDDSPDASTDAKLAGTSDVSDEVEEQSKASTPLLGQLLSGDEEQDNNMDGKENLVNAFDSLPPLGDGEHQKSTSLPLCDGKQQEFTSLPLRGGEQQESTLLSLGGGEQQESTSLPLRGGEQQESTSLSLCDGKQQEFTSLPLRGGEQQESTSLSLRGGEQQESTSLSLGGGEQQESTSLSLCDVKQQEFTSLPLRGGEQQESTSLSLRGGEQQESTSLSLGGGEQQESTSLSLGGGEQQESTSDTDCDEQAAVVSVAAPFDSASSRQEPAPETPKVTFVEHLASETVTVQLSEQNDEESGGVQKSEPSIDGLPS